MADWCPNIAYEQIMASRLSPEDSVKFNETITRRLFLQMLNLSDKDKFKGNDYDELIGFLDHYETAAKCSEASDSAMVDCLYLCVCRTVNELLRDQFPKVDAQGNPMPPLTFDLIKDYLKKFYYNDGVLMKHMREFDNVRQQPHQSARWFMTSVIAAFDKAFAGVADASQFRKQMICYKFYCGLNNEIRQQLTLGVISGTTAQAEEKAVAVEYGYDFVDCWDISKDHWDFCPEC